ncbi:hypothetical protein V6N12_054558 [Hibiscus sabdariffa]|uniref:Uncharacterized protein n=1 Tax=Hibiscus sabdariffa TaxID=183260 RepID=A0ABR2D0T6_9ROSI
MVETFYSVNWLNADKHFVFTANLQEDMWNHSKWKKSKKIVTEDINPHAGGVQAWGQGGTDPFVDLESAVTACCRIDEGITDVVQGKVDMEISSAKNELSPYSQMKKSKKIVSGGINPHAVRKTPWVDASCNILDSKMVVPNVDRTHSTSNDQPLTMAHIHGREVDIRVMSELNCA